jgi:hypothetical protein
VVDGSLDGDVDGSYDGSYSYASDEGDGEDGSSKSKSGSYGSDRRLNTDDLLDFASNVLSVPAPGFGSSAGDGAGSASGAGDGAGSAAGSGAGLYDFGAVGGNYDSSMEYDMEGDGYGSHMEYGDYGGDFEPVEWATAGKPYLYKDLTENVMLGMGEDGIPMPKMTQVTGFLTFSCGKVGHTLGSFPMDAVWTAVNTEEPVSSFLEAFGAKVWDLDKCTFALLLLPYLCACFRVQNLYAPLRRPHPPRTTQRSSPSLCR